MAKALIFVGIFGVLVAATLSFPSIEGDHKLVKGMETRDTGKPELEIKGQDLARGDLTQLTGLFNLSSYLEGRPVNATSLSFIPLITILSSLTGTGVTG